MMEVAAAPREIGGGPVVAAVDLELEAAQRSHRVVITPET